MQSKWRALWAAVVASFAIVVAAKPSDATETRSYVVSMFIPAMYSTEGDCPDGLNPRADALLVNILKEQGVASAEIDKIMAGNWMSQYAKWATDRGRIDGKPANAYIHPLSVPDPKIKTAVGKYGIGFNLDGHDGKNDFIDPLTNEHGVDNQLSRVLGCFDRLRGTPENGATGSVLLWNGVREGMPAWLVQVDINNDQDVQVRIFRAFEGVTRDVAGNVQSYMTYSADPDPRMQHNIFHGTIADGMFVSDAPTNFFMVCDSYVQPEFDSKKTRLRLNFKPDGSIVGYLGGYTPIVQTYLAYAQSGAFGESQGGVNGPAIYQAARALADGDPNPITGERDRISSTYQITAVPAFFATPATNMRLPTAMVR